MTFLHFIDEVPGSVQIRTVSPRHIVLTQRRLGPGHDNNHNPTWLRVENRGAACQVKAEIRWAETGWMNLRKLAYVKDAPDTVDWLKRPGPYAQIQGILKDKSTLFEWKVPHGVSYFGSSPWYSNEESHGFFNSMLRHPQVRIRTVGKTSQGRGIQCLTLGKIQPGRKVSNVVVTARVHANEIPGSFAIEGMVRHLLEGEGKRYLKGHVFHFFQIANPDGVALGIKNTRLDGSPKEFNMGFSSVYSKDPTMRAFRGELDRLKPSALMDIHTYLFPSPFLQAFTVEDTLAMLKEVLRKDKNAMDSSAWSLRYEEPTPEYAFFWPHYYLKFKTLTILTELPWSYHLPRDIEKQGVLLLDALLKVLSRKRK